MEFPEHIDLLCRNKCAYEFIDPISKLDFVGLPSKEAFYSSLDKDNVSAGDYQHAQTVFNTMLCVLIRDYLLVYLNTDVLLLADAFENIRSICISDYNWTQHAVCLVQGTAGIAVS